MVVFFAADVPQLAHHTPYRGIIIIIFGQQSQLFLAAFTMLRIDTAAVSPLSWFDASTFWFVMDNNKNTLLVQNGTLLSLGFDVIF